MPKIIQINFIPFLFFTILTYVAYYLLLFDETFHISISYIIQTAHDLSVRPHLFVLALLPIYIAAMIFGAGLLGVYIGFALQQWLVRALQKLA